MRGSHSKIKNVIPMRADGAAGDAAKAAAIARAVRLLMPKGLDAETKREWRQVATFLADPTVNRLHRRFVDCIKNYCIAQVRLNRFRALFKELSMEIYQIKGRNGIQVKSHPHIGQMNETWRQWYALMNQLGLSPVAERALMTLQQPDFFENDKENFYE